MPTAPPEPQASTAIPQSGGPAPRGRLLTVSLSAIVLAAGLGLYLHLALRVAQEVNTDREAVDQSAYMNYARKMRDTGYGHIGDRNRMPVYPFLLSLLLEDGLTDEGFFERAKTFNILMSAGLLAGLLGIFARYLPWWTSLVLVLVIAFSLFVHRAAYVQCELLFYTLFFASFLMGCRVLSRPSWWCAAAAGALFALAHLTKASASPAFMLLVAAGLGAAFWPSFDRRRLADAAVATACFLAVLFPYLSTSKRVFGRYFYNVNTTFYMWYDTREEIFSGTRAHGDRTAWPELPPDRIPGLGRYLREHTAAQIVGRVTGGLEAIGLAARKGYGWHRYLLIYAGLAAALCIAAGRTALSSARRSVWAVLYATATLGGYVLLYAWISQVHAGLPRLILSLFLPLVFCLAAMAVHGAGAGPGARRAWGVANLGLAVLLAWDVLGLLSGGILRVKGGS